MAPKGKRTGSYGLALDFFSFKSRDYSKRFWVNVSFRGNRWCSVGRKGYARWVPKDVFLEVVWGQKKTLALGGGDLVCLGG